MLKVFQVLVDYQVRVWDQVGQVLDLDKEVFQVLATDQELFLEVDLDLEVTQYEF